MTQPLLTALKPKVVLASINGWEQTIDMDLMYTRMWDTLFDKNPLSSFTFAVRPPTRTGKKCGGFRLAVAR